MVSSSPINTVTSVSLFCSTKFQCDGYAGRIHVKTLEFELEGDNQCVFVLLYLYSGKY